MDRGRTAWRTAAFVDPEEILLRRHLGDRPDLSNDGSPSRRLALRAQDEEQDSAVGVGCREVGPAAASSSFLGKVRAAAVPRERKGMIWLRPEVRAKVVRRACTSDVQLRRSSFRGLVGGKPLAEKIW